MSIKRRQDLTFDEIYSIYYPKLVRFSNEYILSLYDAENIVQDCFLHLWEQKDYLHSINNINAYLFRIVKNKCVDYLRYKISTEVKKQEFQIYLKEFEYKLQSIESFDDLSLSDSEIEAIIYSAINSLPEKCRDIFILSKIKGMKYKEIADQLDISTNTVKNQISNALKKMKDELKHLAPLLLFIIS